MHIYVSLTIVARMLTVNMDYVMMTNQEEKWVESLESESRVINVEDLGDGLDGFVFTIKPVITLERKDIFLQQLESRSIIERRHSYAHKEEHSSAIPRNNSWSSFCASKCGSWQEVVSKEDNSSNREFV